MKSIVALCVLGALGVTIARADDGGAVAPAVVTDGGAPIVDASLAPDAAPVAMAPAPPAIVAAPAPPPLTSAPVYKRPIFWVSVAVGVIAASALVYGVAFAATYTPRYALVSF